MSVAATDDGDEPNTPTAEDVGDYYRTIDRLCREIAQVRSLMPADIGAVPVSIQRVVDIFTHPLAPVDDEDAFVPRREPPDVRRQVAGENGNHLRMHRLAARDGGWACAYCGTALFDICDAAHVRIVDERGHISPRDGRAAPTIDHVIPKAAGGSSEDSNLALACRRCNARKGDQA